MMTSISSDQDVYEEIRKVVCTHFTEDKDLYETIASLANEGKTRLLLSVHNLDALDPLFSLGLLNDPFTFFPPCEEGFRNVFESIVRDDPAYKQHLRFSPHLGLTDWLGSHTVTPRGLSGRLVNKIVCVEGIVTRSSLVHPKLIRSVHFAEASGRHLVRHHNDTSSIQKDRAIVIGVPKSDVDGNEYRVEVGLSGYKDFQRITIQEMPECAPTGQLPRSVDVIAEEDLVDSVKPGDRIRVFGLYRAITYKEGGRVLGYAKSFIVANNLEQLKKDFQSPEYIPLDLRTIREIAARQDAFDILSQSIAPSICGHDLIKKGLLLQLLGGEAKQLGNGMRLRGDIHVLLIGDPSCGKSQLLRFMMNISPLALCTTGRGSSGVGLTAAVTHDQDTGERKLEAGAMVLADKGLVCIDEFDKMSLEDRVSIHEVMEQQTVTISKAGIQTSLNARCSVLAAANPLYGSFDPTVNLKSQISFPDSLLSRFDLIYIVRDAQTSQQDRQICSKVLQQLRYKAEDENSLVPYNGGGMVGGSETATSLGVLQPVISKKQKTNKVWETAVTMKQNADGCRHLSKVLSVDFLHKFIHYAKHYRTAPRLSDAASNRIAHFYSELRQRFVKSSQQGRNHVIPTARTLEACVRLATAHAKLKLRLTVEEEDVEQAEILLLYALCGEVPETKESMGAAERNSRQVPIPQQQTLRNKISGGRGDSQPATSNTTPTRKKKRGHTAGPADLVGNGASSLLQSVEELAIDSVKRRRTNSTPSLVESLATLPASQGLSVVDSEADDGASQCSLESQDEGEGRMDLKRYRCLMKAVSAVQQTASTDSLSMKDVLEKVNNSLQPAKQFEWREFQIGLYKLQSDSRIMLVKGDVWFI